MSSRRGEVGDLVMVTFRDHFTFDPDTPVEEVMIAKEGRKIVGFRAVGWLEGEDEDYIYIRFVRSIPDKGPTISGVDGGFAILKSAITEFQVVREGKK